ncbi:MAG: Uncharacterised protein [Cyanobium sp. ARS6]|nr:MAG: Uncharacterised protein [Cyanobium sp. ARS6]
MGELLLQQTREAKQNFRTTPIQINLIRSECGPHLTLTHGALQMGEQR